MQCTREQHAVKPSAGQALGVQHTACDPLALKLRHLVRPFINIQRAVRRHAAHCCHGPPTCTPRRS